MFKANGRYWRGGWVWQWAGRKSFDAEKAALHLHALRMLGERHRRAAARRAPCA